MNFSISLSLAVLAAIVLPMARGERCDPNIQKTMTIPYTQNGQEIDFNFGFLPPAVSDVIISASFQADMGGGWDQLAEYARVEIAGERLFTLGFLSGTRYNSDENCIRDSRSKTINNGVFNSLVGSSPNAEVKIVIDATEEVGTFCSNDEGTVTISYTARCPCDPEFDKCPCAVSEEIVLPFLERGQDLFFNFGALPPATSEVTVFASLAADLNAGNEYADVEIRSSTDKSLFTLGDGNGGSRYFGNSCRKDEDTATVSAADFNALIASNPESQVHIGMDATGYVSSGCPFDAGVVRISYNICADPTGNGDPHFRTWKNEHFEFHGQCDVVMSSVKNFANRDMDLDIHLRTKMVRHWSFIKTAAIRIGDDILEIEGSAAKEDGLDKRHYWINYEYRGPLTEGLAGFPVTISPRNNVYTIDLDSAYPGQSIEIKTFKEFVGVKIHGASPESFGSSVGIIGDFSTGKTLSRDGSTTINDFNDLGMEWQVLPSDGKLFREASHPQFPELCLLPEDPRGDRTRRLAESDITEEQAEAACAGLQDKLDRKDCIYDILATQDMDMVGAY